MRDHAHRIVGGGARCRYVTLVEIACRVNLTTPPQFPSNRRSGAGAIGVKFDRDRGGIQLRGKDLNLKKVTATLRFDEDSTDAQPGQSSSSARRQAAICLPATPLSAARVRYLAAAGI